MLDVGISGACREDLNWKHLAICIASLCVAFEAISFRPVSCSRLGSQHPTVPGVATRANGAATEIVCINLASKLVPISYSFCIRPSRRVASRQVQATTNALMSLEIRQGSTA